MHNLQDVNWQLLKTCYGNAEGIPKWLEQLASSDSSIRQHALEELTDQIYHQGTVYEATPHVVPFLIDLLSDPSVQEKENILGLLWILELTHPPLGQPSKSLQLTPTKDERDFDQKMALFALYVKRTQEEIRKGIPIYLSLLEQESPKVKIESARLLAELRQDAQPILSTLLQHAQAEIDENIKATLVWAMGSLLENGSDISSYEKSQFVAFLSKLVMSAEGVLVKFAASLSQLKAMGNNASQEAIEFVIDFAFRSGEYPNLLWIDVALWTACDALSRLSGEKRILAFEKMLAKCGSVADAHAVVITLLNSVFRGKDAKRLDLGIGYNRASDGTQEWHYTTNYKVIPVQKLTQQQEAAVKLVLKCQKFWEIRNNLLEAYGLPGSRDELQQFLTNMSAK